MQLQSSRIVLVGLLRFQHCTASTVCPRRTRIWACKRGFWLWCQKGRMTRLCGRRGHDSSNVNELRAVTGSSWFLAGTSGSRPLRHRRHRPSLQWGRQPNHSHHRLDGAAARMPPHNAMKEESLSLLASRIRRQTIAHQQVRRSFRVPVHTPTQHQQPCTSSVISWML